jgi:hypothetical protein
MLIRLASALLLGVAAAVLVSCGSSGAGLIPAADAGPLEKDFEAVTQAAEVGNGSCVETESALGKTEQDFLRLPESIDKGLRARLEQGIGNLHKRALEMCAEPSAGSTTTTGTQKTTTGTATTPPNTTSTQTTTTGTTPPSTTPEQTTTTGTTPTNQNGGTAPGETPGEAGAGKEGEAGVGASKEGEAGANSGGANAGGVSPGGGQ